MAELGAVRDRTWSLFLEPSTPRRAAFNAEVAAGAAEVAAATFEKFSAFNKRHLARAMEVVAELMRRADSLPGEQGLDAALDYYEEIRTRENPDLVDYALMVFITHHVRGRALTHSIPPITLRNPELAVPSSAAPESSVLGPEALGEFAAEAVSSEFTGGAQPTDNLEWYREDPFANEHHTHWHVVYPTVGIPDPADPSRSKFKERQGEVFFYMHQQMLARYDAERVALELSRVQPLADYRAAVAVGYDPGPYLQAQGFAPRPPGRSMVSLQDYSVSDHEDRRARLNQANRDRAFNNANPPVPIDKVDLLGATVESNGVGIGSVAGPAVGDFYGDLHNIGHGMLAGASDGGPGVMTTTELAIRDPVFYEWHKHVDDFYTAWQDKGGPQSFSDRPLVRLRKQFDPDAARAVSPDILLAFEDQLPPESAGDLQAWARGTFGGDHWDEDFSQTATTTATLETVMLQRRLTLADRVTSVPLEHLIHRPFVWIFRIENQVDRAVQVTVRVFLVPLAQAEDRRSWIEMDKFVQPLQPLEKAVAARRGAQSSVIRKPAVMRPEVLKEAGIRLTDASLAAMQADGLPATIVDRLRPFAGRVASVNELFAALGRQRWNVAVPFLLRHAEILPPERPRRPDENDAPDDIEQIEAANYCTCGWPYNLLVPRGTEAGMPFRVAVICSDWEIDQAGGDESCGSLSFCGARDRYPDKRDMGYPFDRPFEEPIRETILANPNMAFRDITIRRMPDAIAED